MKFYFDTSVLVAASVAQHPHHLAGTAVYREVMSGQHSGVVSAHGLAETFSALTRLPLSPMIHPTEAYRIITETVVRHCETIPLEESDYLAILETAARAGLGGGGLGGAALHRRHYGRERLGVHRLGPGRHAYLDGSPHDASCVSDSGTGGGRA